jgi:hypothetical protein
MGTRPIILMLGMQIMNNPYNYKRIKNKNTGTRPLLRRKPSYKKSGSILWGGISLLAFIFFWMFILIGVNVVMSSVKNGSGTGMTAGGVIALIGFLFPLVGLTTGIIGIVKTDSHKILSTISLILNCGVLLFVGYGVVSRHA